MMIVLQVLYQTPQMSPCHLVRPLESRSTLDTNLICQVGKHYSNFRNTSLNNIRKTFSFPTSTQSNHEFPNLTFSKCLVENGKFKKLVTLASLQMSLVTPLHVTNVN